MTATKRWALTGALIFFGLGLGWGILSSRGFSIRGSGTPLTIICPKSWLPPAIAEDIARDLKVRVVQMDFKTWSEFVRLIANTQGGADIICYHSFLAKDLIQSKFLDRVGYQSLPHFSHISVDFSKLPFDPDFSYGAPLFWGVNGFVVKDSTPGSWKAIWPSQGQKMSLLFPDIELLWRMSLSGLEIGEEVSERPDEARKFQSFVQNFFQMLSDVSTNRPELSPEELKKFQYIQLSSGPASVFLKNHSDWKYWLPTDGVSLWFGMVGIGSKSRNKVVARNFIDGLLRPENALLLHKMLNHGVVQALLDGAEHVQPMQKAQYLRDIPLDRVRFPNLSLEILPRWERLVTEAKRL